MQRFRWPGYEVHLLRELQRQQNSSQYCDTLLQAEEILVPTHSCVLAALSPFLSRELSASPSPPSGQKRQLQLPSVKAKTLVKLVALLYSGEVEVREPSEKLDLLAAAHWLGIARLVEERGDSGTRSEDFLYRRGGFTKAREGLRRSNTRDAQVQAEMTERGEGSPLVRSKTCASAGTQTDEDTAGGSVIGQIQHVFPVPVALAAQFVDVCVGPQPQILPLDPSFSLSACQPVFLDGVLTCGQSPDAVINPTPAPVPPDDLNLAGEDDVLPGSPEPEDGVPASVGEAGGPEGGGAEGSARDAREDEVSGDKAGSSAVRKPAGMKSVAKMRQMMETAHISIKVKLRRRMKGELWEVVSTQSGDDSLSLQTSLKQDRQRLASPQKDPRDARPPPPAVHLHSLGKPESWSAQTTNSSSQRSEPIISDSDSQPLSSCCLDPHELGPDPQDAAEETDEQIERLLEDIMMGLNILPEFDRGGKKSLQTDAGLQFGLDARLGESDAISCQNASTSECQASPYPKGAAAGYLTFQQEDQRILDLLPLSNETETEGSFLLDELRLPQCLSPLAPGFPPARRPPLSSSSTNTESQTRGSLRRRPWLAEKPGSLQFPFPTVTDGETKAAPLPQEVLQTSPWSWTDVKEREVKTKKTKCSNFQQNDTKVDSAAPKKKKTAHKRCFLAQKQSKLNKGTKTVCSVNLSSNNVLVSGTEMATGSSIRSLTDVEEQNETSSIVKSLTKNRDRPAGPRSARPRIRTRGFVRKSQESAEDAIREVKPEVRPAAAETRQDPPPLKRGRGRPRKWSQDSRSSDLASPVIVDKSSDVDNNEEKADSLATEEQNVDTARQCKKRKMSVNEEEEVPLKKTSAERTDEVVPDDAGDGGTLRKPQPVSLTEFQKVFKQQHWKTRKSKEGRECEGAASDGGSEGDEERTSQGGTDVEEKPNPGDDQAGAQEAGFRPGSESAAPISSSSEDSSVLVEDRLESSSSEDRPETPSTGGEESLMDAEEVIMHGTSESDGIDSSRSDCWTQENQTASGHQALLQTAEEAAPHLSGAAGLIRTPGSLPGGEEEEEEVKEEEEEEQEEEEDVDVLLCSPEKDPRITACESGLGNADIAAAAADEEEDEEIDVTGDETE